MTTGKIITAGKSRRESHSVRAFASSTSSTSNSRCLPALLILASIASLMFSANAIRCHQCNSHLDEDCTALRLSLPHNPRDEHYLRECETDNAVQAFCRKTAITIEATDEHRIIRSCGWIRDPEERAENLCFSAESEGFTQIICSCFEDGCNAASAPHRTHAAVHGLVGLTTLSAGYALTNIFLR